jgi:pyrroloquinoline quinone (PQQ) biosynthesis protein C
MSTATDIMIERPMSRDAFSSALYAAEQSYRCEDTRLYRLLLSDRCPRSVLLRYARSTYYSAILFCATVAEFAIRAPDPEAKLIMLENLLEEEGMHLRADRGIVVRPEQRHVALARRFLRACGGDENDVHPDAMHATAPGRALLAEGRWLEAMSFLFIGQELKFGTASGLLFDALRRRGLAARDLAFFAVHVEGDTRHGGQALKLVADRADTLEVQCACLAAADAGAGLWFTMHGGRAARATA